MTSSSGSKLSWGAWILLAGALGLGALRVETRAVAKIQLDDDFYVPGQVPTLDFSSPGFPKAPPQTSDRIQALVSFSTDPNATQSSLFPPFALGLASGPISFQIQLDPITCDTVEQFLQGEISDPVTGQTLVLTNEVLLRVDKSSCDPRPVGGQGCPPEIWNDPEHYSSWPIPLVPLNRFDDIFDDAFPGSTLQEVLNVGDGALRELGRQTAAALLNSWSPAVNYDLTAKQVVTLFDQTFPGSDDAYWALADYFAALNHQSCPINDPAPPGR